MLQVWDMYTKPMVGGEEDEFSLDKDRVSR